MIFIICLWIHSDRVYSDNIFSSFCAAYFYQCVEVLVIYRMAITCSNIHRKSGKDEFKFLRSGYFSCASHSVGNCILPLFISSLWLHVLQDGAFLLPQVLQWLRWSVFLESVCDWLCLYIAHFPLAPHNQNLRDWLENVVSDENVLFESPGSLAVLPLCTRVLDDLLGARVLVFGCVRT